MILLFRFRLMNHIITSFQTNLYPERSRGVHYLCHFGSACQQTKAGLMTRIFTLYVTKLYPERSLGVQKNCLIKGKLFIQQSDSPLARHNL